MANHLELAHRILMKMKNQHVTIVSKLRKGKNILLTLFQKIHFILAFMPVIYLFDCVLRQVIGELSIILLKAIFAGLRLPSKSQQKIVKSAPK